MQHSNARNYMINKPYNVAYVKTQPLLLDLSASKHSANCGAFQNSGSLALRSSHSSCSFLIRACACTDPRENFFSLLIIARTSASVIMPPGALAGAGFSCAAGSGGGLRERIFSCLDPFSVKTRLLSL